MTENAFNADLNETEAPAETGKKDKRFGRSPRLGGVVASAIHQAGFSTPHAASQALGLSRSSLNQVCHGFCSEHNAVRILDALGFDLVIAAVPKPKRQPKK